MRISLLALAMAILLPTTWAAAGEMRTTTYVDPITGVRTTETIRESDWTTYYSSPYRVVRTSGYRVLPGRLVTETVGPEGFPLNPYDGKVVWLNGRKYEWDADDAEWERD